MAIFSTVTVSCEWSFSQRSCLRSLPRVFSILFLAANAVSIINVTIFFLQLAIVLLAATLFGTHVAGRNNVGEDPAATMRRINLEYKNAIGKLLQNGT